MDLASLVELKKRLDALRVERRRLCEQAREARVRASRAIAMNREVVEQARLNRQQAAASISGARAAPVAPVAPASASDQTCMFMMSE